MSLLEFQGEISNKQPPPLPLSLKVDKKTYFIIINILYIEIFSSLILCRVLKWSL